MIKKIVERWEKNKNSIRNVFAEKHPDGYGAILAAVIDNVQGDEDDLQRHDGWNIKLLPIS